MVCVPCEYCLTLAAVVVPARSGGEARTLVTELGGVAGCAYNCKVWSSEEPPRCCFGSHFGEVMIS
jgi:hypothetical protein